MNKTILLVDDQETFLNALKKGIESLGYLVEVAANGAAALQLLAHRHYDAIVSDIQMPMLNGLEFLREARTKTPDTPVVLMTGFGELADSNQATRDGARAFLAKPFKIGDLQKILCEIFGVAPAEKSEPPRNLDEDFFPLLIDEFLSGKKIRYDIFIRMSSYKYLKIAHGGEDLEPGRVAKFKGKGLRVFFLRREDYKHYVSFLLNLGLRTAENPSVDFQKKVQVLRLAGEAALKGMFEGAFQEPELGEAKMIVNGLNRVIGDNDSLTELLHALKSSSDTLYAHALGVSTVAVMMARVLEWKSQASVLSIGLAGFFHDIGKKEFPRTLLEKARMHFTPEEVALYETHPVRGANLLGALPKFPPEVVQAVLQHHEACSGVGFPKHLTRVKIIPIARVIAIADEFSKSILPGPDCLEITPREVIERMRNLKADYFDPEYMRALESIVIR